MFGQGTGVDALNARDVRALEVFVERARRAPVARDGAELFDHKAADVGLSAFLVERIDSIIADLRAGHGDDLSAIGWVGKHLLVSGHRGVETNFTHRRAARAKAF